MTTAASTWPAPPQNCPLEEKMVHVWRARLDVEPASVARLWQTLSDDEQARADRFYFERDRRRFIVARGVLRSLLGDYLQTSPAALRFVYNAFGKPALAADFGAAVQFNLAHSGELALFAFTLNAEIGVDVEAMRADLHFLQLAEHVFSAQERATLYALPAEQQCAAFFRCWTRKEAYIKAKGQGLSLPLTGFSVTLHPDEPARLQAVEGDSRAAQRWSIYDLAPGTGYQGAVVVESAGWALHRWQWPMSRV